MCMAFSSWQAAMAIRRYSCRSTLHKVCETVCRVGLQVLITVPGVVAAAAAANIASWSTLAERSEQTH